MWADQQLLPPPHRNLRQFHNPSRVQTSSKTWQTQARVPGYQVWQCWIFWVITHQTMRQRSSLLKASVSTDRRHCSFSSLLYRITCRHSEITHACYMAQEKGTMNKFRFLLTRSSERGNNSVKNSIPWKLMVMLLRNEYYALLLQIHQKLILFTQNYFCLHLIAVHFNRFGINQEQLENMPFDYP